MKKSWILTELYRNSDVQKFEWCGRSPIEPFNPDQDVHALEREPRRAEVPIRREIEVAGVEQSAALKVQPHHGRTLGGTNGTTGNFLYR